MQALDQTRPPSSKTSSFLAPALALACLASPLLAQNDPPQVIAWNDLGMHCIDPDFSIFAILPPFNTVNAHVILNGQLQNASSGIRITYEGVADSTGSINTSSIGKTNFWDHVQSLFGVSLPLDVGLTGNAMPGAGNVPQPMLYDPAWAWFQGEGIPFTPLDDVLLKNNYPLIRITARTAGGAFIASTVTSVPVSSELECSRCHASGASPFARPASGWAYDPDPLVDDRLNILQLHDERELGNPAFVTALATAGFNAAGLLATVEVDGRAVLCSTCHLSNALPGTGLPGVKPMTQAIHGLHGQVADLSGVLLDDIADRSSCYTCHPGFDTQCLRGAMGKAIGPDGVFAMNCQSCHGNQSQVGDPNRVGWLEQIACQNCHTGTATNNSGAIRFTSAFDASGLPRVAASQVFATTPDVPAAGFSLYRFSDGHGDMQCSTCHGSPHAIFPTDFANDNVQSIRLQGHSGTVVDCAACHGNLEDNQLSGPHGMHPINADWANGKHGDVAENGGLAQCRSCHGFELRGSVLSRAIGNRNYNTKYGPKNFWRGFEVGCFACHNGPNSENPTNNVAPFVPDFSAQTPNDVPLPLLLTATDPGPAPISFRIVSQPKHGTVALSGSNATFLPEAGYVGGDSFTYAASDGTTDSNLATVQLAVLTAACSSTSKEYGFGCPGEGGFMPHLSAIGCSTPGQTVTLHLERGLGGSLAVLALGRREATIDVLDGCTLRVKPLLYVSLPIKLSGVLPGEGEFSVPLSVDPSFIGLTYTMQAFVGDPAAKGGLSASNGLSLTTN